MTIIFGFVLPIVLFVITIPLKLAIKSYQVASLGAKVTKTAIRVGKRATGKIANSPRALEDRFNRGTGENAKELAKTTSRLAQLITKAGVVALRIAIRTLKAIIWVIRAAIIVLETLLSLGLIGIVIIVLLLMSCIASVVILINSEPSKMNLGVGSSGTSISSTSGVQSAFSDFFFVGDSRTVGLACQVDGRSYVSRPDADGNAGIADGDEKYIACGSQGLAWAKKQQEAILKIRNKNIVFNFGVNDLTNAEEYVSWYAELCQNTEWVSNNKLFFLSVNPVNEVSYTYAGEGQASKFNSAIESFNATIKGAIDGGQLSAFTYLDSYNSDFMQSCKTDTSLMDSEGLHYVQEIYQKLKEFVESQVTVSSGSSSEATTARSDSSNKAVIKD